MSGLISANLADWAAESYPESLLGGGRGIQPGEWNVAADGESVIQINNGQPTLFCSPFESYNLGIQGRIEVETGNDDDFVGFALGFNPGDTMNESADYLLIDWKQVTQSRNWGCSEAGEGRGLEGLAVSRVTGIPDLDEMWSHDDFGCTPEGQGLQELARGNNLGNVGWEDFNSYEFRFNFSPNNLQVLVNGQLEMDINGSFANGNFCYYNLSQDSVRYSGFRTERLFTPASEPSRMPTPSQQTTPTAPFPSQQTPSGKNPTYYEQNRTYKKEMKKKSGKKTHGKKLKKKDLKGKKGYGFGGYSTPASSPLHGPPRSSPPAKVSYSKPTHIPPPPVYHYHHHRHTSTPTGDIQSSPAPSIPSTVAVESYTSGRPVRHHGNYNKKKGKGGKRKGYKAKRKGKKKKGNGTFSFDIFQ